LIGFGEHPAGEAGTQIAACGYLSAPVADCRASTSPGAGWEAADAGPVVSGSSAEAQRRAGTEAVSALDR